MAQDRNAAQILPHSQLLNITGALLQSKNQLMKEPTQSFEKVKKPLKLNGEFCTREEDIQARFEFVAQKCQNFLDRTIVDPVRLYYRFTHATWLDMAGFLKDWGELWTRLARQETLVQPPHVANPQGWRFDPDATEPWRLKCVQWQMTFPANSPELRMIIVRAEELRNRGDFAGLYPLEIQMKTRCRGIVGLN